MALTLTPDQLEQIRHDLAGQCMHGLSDVLEAMGIDYDELTPDDLDEIDARVFLCERCSWWCDADELDDDSANMTCEECAKEKRHD